MHDFLYAMQHSLHHKLYIHKNLRRVSIWNYEI